MITIYIWKFCCIADGACFIASMNHNYKCLTTCDHKELVDEIPNVWASIHIWHDVWIWKNAIIMKWVNIWIWAVVWAWAVVTKDVPPYAIVWWNPAKIIKFRFDDEKIKNLLKSERWNRDLSKIRENYYLQKLY